MDPLETVKPWKDTSYYLMLAAVERGHEVYVTTQSGLTLRHNRLFADARCVKVFDDHDRPFDAGQTGELDLGTVDVAWERTDPPVNRRYLYASLLLDFLPESVTVINRPAAIRDWNEKLSALRFPELTPATLVTSRADEIRRFAEGFDRITLKPIDGHGGKGVEFVEAGSPQFDSVAQRVTGDGRRWTIVQEYLAEANEGDKRILLLAGEPIGAVLRVHAEGKELNNFDQGGAAFATTLTERDLEICAAVGPELRQSGILFAGIDVIGGKLMEVNVTSPTGLQEAARFGREPLHHRIIERLESGWSA
ncbi:MAG: glutathione synthase [Proteobacteria bacterium]|nr:MAG: glutathione synthase [Pseudomonadota bacterium]